MAYANDIRSAAPASSASFGGLFKSLAERFARYKVYRETVLELSGLTDRDLADMGMSRASINAVAYEAAYSK
ncbi:DUF1127 domain-containing protein [Celeribacter baekdonensis]|jgi:uncharacterized protein YjiS (DUF1127 family)|uniref:YjiS-like domain-containing protein n=1 Tax=Celeribacter baekdonensis TaxID=875171 RepID=A0A2R4M2U4_9RHOB|nr:DUF1127 domain-containing protein [Celeribacter baekdonensis]AVW91540.1 hypothetical protein DA792_10975 [Celeribacter baekdonensis]|tara:strand:+ start:155886 stop:156101 length:216 start_codon:yes stop_codon:yes gene_type:complete